MKLPDPGDRLAEKYLIEAILGEGGFGRVYLATTEGTGRQVAIKVLKPAADNFDQKARRFLRELKTVAQLEHPNTVTLYDYGRTDDGLLFMVCEYVPGEDLSTLLTRRGRLTEAEVVHILVQTAESLREAHGIGVLHRDLKPDNVRLTEYQGDPLVVRLLDFGIAKSLSDDTPGLTATGKVIGTPRYMSPEQLTGQELTPASDIYGLGVVAYEMLMGRASTARAPGIGRLRLEQSHGVSEPLRAIVNGMLELDDTRRIQTADELLRALRGLRRYSTEPPRPPLAVGLELGAVPSTSEDPEEHVAPPAPASINAKSLVIGTAIGVLVTVFAVLLLSKADDVQAPPPGPSNPSEPTKPHAERTPKAPGVANVASVADVTATPDAGEDKMSGCGRPAPPLTGTGPGRILHGVGSALLTYEPEGYDPNVRHPILLLLHSATETNVRMFTASEAREAADRHGFVVIAPRDPSTFPFQAEGDVPVIEQAIAAVEELFCVDRNEVYVLSIGTSGNLAERLHCFLPSVRAVATVGHRYLEDSRCEGDEARSVPYIHFTGLADKGLNPSGGVSCLGKEVRPLKEHDAYWRERLDCKGSRKRYLSEGSHMCWTWECETPYVSCHLDGGRGFRNGTPRTFDLLKCDGKPPDFDIMEAAAVFFGKVRDARHAE